MTQKVLQFKLINSHFRVLLLSTLIFTFFSCSKERTLNKISTSGNEYWYLEKYEFKNEVSNEIKEFELTVSESGEIKIKKFVPNSHYYDSIIDGIHFFNYQKFFRLPKNQFPGTLDSANYKFDFSKSKKGIITCTQLPEKVATPLIQTKFEMVKMKSDKWVIALNLTNEGNFTEQFTFRKTR